MLSGQTIGYTRNGFISWVNRNDWKKSVISPIAEELFWIKLTVNIGLSFTTKLKAITNIFCDDDLLRSLYPELIADIRYLPPGRTNFIDQYIMAKDFVVTRLTQKKVIMDESQIIDINQVAISAAHAAAMIILTPIAKSEQSLALLARARDNFEGWLSEVNLGIDENEDGIISEQEKQQINSGNITMRGN